MRVLLIGINYEPEQTGIGPYTSGFARHMADRGHQVTVVTGLPSYPEWRVQVGFRRSRRRHERIGGVNVKRRWHYVPRKQSAARRALYELSFVISGLSALQEARPDVVLGVVPSLGGGVLARLAARRFRVPYAVLFQDMMSRGAMQSGVSGGSAVSGLVGRLEAWVARGAASIGIVTEGFRSHLLKYGVDSQRVVRVRNWAHISEPTLDSSDTRRQFGLPAQAVICLHAGNMGYKQDLANVVGCARLASPDPALLFVLMGEGSQRRNLERSAGALDNVLFLPVQGDESFRNILGAADILLLNQRASITDMALPGKLTSYFQSGRPIVAAVSQQSETRRELEAAPAAVLVAPNDAASLLSAIRALASDLNLRRTLGEIGESFARSVLKDDRCLRQLEEWLCAIPFRGSPRDEA